MKRAILEFSPQLMVEICKVAQQDFLGSIKVIKNGLPTDAKVVDMQLKELNIESNHRFPHSILIILESESFCDTPVGNVLPFLDVPELQAVREV